MQPKLIQLKVWSIDYFLMNQKLRAVEADAVTAKVDTKAAREPAITVNSRPTAAQLRAKAVEDAAGLAVENGKIKAPPTLTLSFLCHFNTFMYIIIILVAF